MGNPTFCRGTNAVDGVAPQVGIHQRAAAMKWMSVRATAQAVQAKGHKIGHEGVARVLRPRRHDRVRARGPLFVALAVAGAAHADPMVCRTEAGVTHCEAPLNHCRVTGTRKGNRTYFEDNKGRRWMMIEEEGRTTIIPR